MKKQDITFEIVDLAEQIAKHWKMEIYRGCWIKIGGEVQLITSTCDDYFFTGCNCFKNRWANRKGSGVPIPSISDVYSLVNSKGYTIDAIQDHDNMVNKQFNEVNIIHTNLTEGWRGIGKNIHEAFLGALLAMFQGENSER